jgi:hypothetical protein
VHDISVALHQCKSDGQSSISGPPVVIRNEKCVTPLGTCLESTLGPVSREDLKTPMGWVPPDGENGVPWASWICCLRDCCLCIIVPPQFLPPPPAGLRIGYHSIKDVTCDEEEITKSWPVATLPLPEGWNQDWGSESHITDEEMWCGQYPDLEWKLRNCSLVPGKYLLPLMNDDEGTLYTIGEEVHYLSDEFGWRLDGVLYNGIDELIRGGFGDVREMDHTDWIYWDDDIDAEIFNFEVYYQNARTTMPVESCSVKG